MFLIKSLSLTIVFFFFRYSSLSLKGHDINSQFIDDQNWILMPYLATTEKQNSVVMSCRLKDAISVDKLWLSEENSTVPLEENSKYHGIIKKTYTLSENSVISKYTYIFNDIGKISFYCYAQIGEKIHKSVQKIRIRIRSTRSYNPIGVCLKYHDFGSQCLREFSGENELVYTKDTTDNGTLAESYISRVMSELSVLSSLPKKCNLYMKPFICSFVYSRCHVSEPNYFASYTELCATEFMFLRQECIPIYQKSSLFSELISQNLERYNLLFKIHYNECFHMESNIVNQISLQPSAVSVNNDEDVNLTCSINLSNMSSSIKHIIWTKDMNTINVQNLSINQSSSIIRTVAKADLEYTTRRYQCTLELFDGTFINSNPSFVKMTNIPFRNNGYCLRYSDYGSVCSSVIDVDRIVHIISPKEMQRVETDIKDMLDTFQPSLPMNCRISFLPFICNLAYPKCNPYANTGKDGIDVQGICHEEYSQHLATCGFYYRLSDKFEGIQNLPEYNSKSNTANSCIRFPERKYSISTTCKRDDGANYRGILNLTASGRPCLRWKDTKFRDLINLHESKGINNDNYTINTDHNYCRNPLLHEFTSFMTGPFCVVGKDELGDYEYELCEIRECGYANLYVVGGSSSLLGLVLILLFCFLLLIPSYRRKYFPSLEGIGGPRFLKRKGMIVTIPLDDCTSLNAIDKNTNTEIFQESQFIETEKTTCSNSSHSGFDEMIFSNSITNDENEIQHFSVSNSTTSKSRFVDHSKIDQLINSLLSVHNYSDEKQKITVEHALRSVPIFYKSEFQKVRNLNISIDCHKTNLASDKNNLPELKLETVEPSLSNYSSSHLQIGYLKIGERKQNPEKKFVAVRKLVESPDELVFRYSLKHENVLSILGIMHDDHDPINGFLDVIFEYSLSDDVLSFIKYGSHFDWPKCNLDFLQIALQVASGLAYLETMAFVHGDISLRNCKVFPSLDRDGIPLVQISDFAKYLPRYRSDYTIIPSCSCKYTCGVCIGKVFLPLRWLSPELLGYFFKQSEISVPTHGDSDVRESENIDPATGDDDSYSKNVCNQISEEYLKNYCTILEIEDEHHQLNEKKELSSPSFPSNLTNDPNHFIWYTLSRVPGSKASDIWSYGILLYELYHHHLPSSRLPLEEYITMQISDSKHISPMFNNFPVYNFQLPLEIKQLIKRCLEHNPSKRSNFTEIFSFLNRISEKNDFVPPPFKESNKESSPIFIN